MINLNKLYPNIKIVSSFIEKQYEFNEGVKELQYGYGIDLAEKCGLPKEMLDYSREFRKIVKINYEIIPNKSITVNNNLIDNEDNKLELIKRILPLNQSTLNNDGVKQCINID